MMRKDTISILADLGKRYPSLLPCIDSCKQAMDVLIGCYSRGNKLLVCGNGGSASDALHIVGELMKGFLLPRKLQDAVCSAIRQVSSDPDHVADGLQCALPAIALVSETSLMTAFSNDMYADLVFAQQVVGYGKPGDVLLCISTSGNSSNVLHAAEVAKAVGVTVLSLTGADGGKLRQISDVLIAVPETETFKVQELHLPVYHALCMALENEFFGTM
ncbi:MAG TPA: phosphoheptose isomerase [Sphaerochaeta sp.]|nr:phosphoheptose isomerase [Sphaerochaeta sp.]